MKKFNYQTVLADNPFDIPKQLEQDRLEGFTPIAMTYTPNGKIVILLRKEA